MKRTLNKTVITLVIIAILLALTVVPGKRYFSRRTFDEALSFDSAKSTVIIKINPVFHGKLIQADRMLLLDIGSAIKTRQKIALKPFKNTVKQNIPAKWIDMKFEGFDKNGKPIYNYIFRVKKYEITLIDTKDSLIGAAIVSLIPNKPVLEIPVKVNMRKTNFKKEKSTAHLLSNGNGYTEIEEYKDDIYNFTKIANLHSARQERSRMVFPRGSIVYIQSKYRSNSTEPLTTTWSDAGPTATQVTAHATSGYEQNGSASIIKMRVHYAYMRKKVVAYTNYGTFVSYEETVYPLDSGGNGVENYRTNLYEPFVINGNKKIVGSSEGAQLDFDLKGTSGYHFTPAVTLSFGANYGASGGTVDISLSLSSEEHYRQSPYVNAYIYGSNGTNNNLWGFDNGTNWKEIYFRWKNQ